MKSLPRARFPVRKSPPIRPIAARLRVPLPRRRKSRQPQPKPPPRARRAERKNAALRQKNAENRGDQRRQIRVQRAYGNLHSAKQRKRRARCHRQRQNRRKARPHPTVFIHESTSSFLFQPLRAKPERPPFSAFPAFRAFPRARPRRPALRACARRSAAFASPYPRIFRSARA